MRRGFLWMKDSVLHLRFVQGVVCCWGVYMLGTLVWWHSRSVLYVFGAAVEYSSFTFLFPACAVLPYALRYRENRKSGMDRMILQRCTVRHYLTDMLLKTAASGFLAMAGGGILFLHTIPLFFPDAVLAYEVSDGIIWPYMEDIARCENWAAYFSAYFALMGIAGAFFSVFALMVSAWVDDVYAVFIVPVLFLYAADYALMRFQRYSLSTLMFGMYFFDSRTELWMCSLATFGLMGAVCALFFYLKGRRQCRECG